MDSETPEGYGRPRIFGRSRTLGSGRIQTTPSKTLVHFGSPAGTQFSPKSDDNPEWLF